MSGTSALRRRLARLRKGTAGREGTMKPSVRQGSSNAQASAAPRIVLESLSTAWVNSPRKKIANAVNVKGDAIGPQPSC